ncbi:MAG: hypothetical protein ABIC95_06035 [archaeon]
MKLEVDLDNDPEVSLRIARAAITQKLKGGPAADFNAYGEAFKQAIQELEKQIGTAFPKEELLNNCLQHGIPKDASQKLISYFKESGDFFEDDGGLLHRL